MGFRKSEIDRLPILARNRDWRRGYLRYGATKEFMRSLLEEEEPPHQDEEPATDPIQYEHDFPYYYAEARDIYVIAVKSRKRPLIVPGDVWRSIRDAYSNWDGAPASINDIARRFGISRRVVQELLRAMGTTHDSSPYTDEEIVEGEEEALVQDLIRRKEQSIYAKAEKRRWRNIEEESLKWRLVENSILDPMRSFLTSGDGSKPVVNIPKADIRDDKDAKNYAVVIGLTDWHYGCLGADFGHDGYGRDIALKRMWGSVESVMKRVLKRNRTPDWIGIPIGSDNLHADTYKQTTTSLNTNMHVDGSMRTLVRDYLYVMKSLVEYLAQFGPVKLLPCFGNHDRMLGIATYVSLSILFEDDDRVTAEGDLRDICVLTYGDTMIALNHGDIHKPGSLGDIIPRDFSRQWGETKYHHAMCGHYHTNATFKDKSGLMVHYMSSLAGSDEYHVDNGWGGPGARHALDCFVFEPDMGLTTIEYESAK